MKTLFVIHTPKDPNTAVCKIYLERKKNLESGGVEAELIGQEDFPSLKRFKQFSQLLFPFAVARFISKRKGDYQTIVFHSYSGWVFNLVKRFSKRTAAIKTITEFHGLEPLFIRELITEYKLIGKPVSLRFRFYYQHVMNWILKWSCRQSDRVLCLNEQEKAYLVDHKFQKSEAIDIIRNDVALNFFADREYSTEAKRLLFVGQWLITKGTRYLVDAFCKLNAQHPDLELILVGTLKNKEEVLADFPSEVRRQIEVYPSVKHKDISQYYRAADIFIFPSLSEGSSCSVVEAMASGLPVVSTPVGYAAELLKHNANALVIQKRDNQAIVDAVNQLVSDASGRRILGESARECVRVFEQSSNTSQWKDAYFHAA